MGDIPPARWAGDDVVLAQRVLLIAEAEQPLSFENEEHLLLHAMVVEGADLLAGRADGQVVAELLRADLLADHAILALERAVGVRHDREIVEIDHGLHTCPPLQSGGAQAPARSRRACSMAARAAAPWSAAGPPPCAM